MTPILLIAAAAAGWTESASKNDCTFYVGERLGDFAPVRAECNWPVDPAKLQALIAKLEDHDQYFSSVKVAEKLPAAGLYRQVHVAAGISDREIILEMGSTSIEGGTQYWWKKAADQSALTGAGVEAVDDYGKWEVTANADGTAHVVYELFYNPGGSVPSFLVRSFQGSGMQQLVGELRTAAGG